LTIFAVTGRHVKPLHHGATFFRSFEVVSVFLSASNKNYFTTRRMFWQVLFLFFSIFFVGMKKTPVMAEAITGRPDEFKKGYFA
ncbi:hypothetical protein, partial [Megasphaera sp.]|uniref:hypothetical protein n=1 Tax=Megasphaera sp. TaxID=2023260 RepID=UPI004026561B